MIGQICDTMIVATADVATADKEWL